MRTSRGGAASMVLRNAKSRLRRLAAESSTGSNKGARAGQSSPTSASPPRSPGQRSLGAELSTDTESLTLGEGDKHDDMVNVKRSLADMKRWPGLVNGYTNLGMFTAFFGLYIYILLAQQDIPNGHKIDFMVRTGLLDQDGALASVNAPGDFFDYLLKGFDSQKGAFLGSYSANPTPTFTDDSPGGGILGKLFVSQDYNGKTLGTNESGYLFNYNKLIGGVQIVQQRGRVGSCPSGASLYDLFYPSCYLNDAIQAIPPQMAGPNGTTIDNLLDPAFVNATIASRFGDRTLLDNPDSAYYPIRSAFEYNHSLGGYGIFLSVAESATGNLKIVQDLSTLRWLDAQTRKITLKFTFYNGHFGRFAFAATTLTFSQVGQFVPYDPNSAAVARKTGGGTEVRVASVNMEPYLVEADFVRLGLELVFMASVFAQCSHLVRLTALSALRRRLLIPPHWFFLDCANMACFIVFIALRIVLVTKIYSNPVAVPTNQYKKIFEECSNLTDTQISFSFINVLLCTLRFFKYYEFQPRLRIVNKTIGAATVHLIHFMIIFLVFFVGFAVLGNIIFGAQVRDFFSIPYAMMALFESLLGNIGSGPTIGNANLYYISPYLGLIFFFIWIFISFLVLFNIFIAILMDAYSSAKEAGREDARREGLENPRAVVEDVVGIIARMMNSMRPRSWKAPAWLLQEALARTARKMEDAGFATVQDELKSLERSKKALEARIDELKSKGADEDPGTWDYHPVWQTHAVPLGELISEMVKIQKEQKSKAVLDPAVAREVASAHLAFVAQENITGGDQQQQQQLPPPSLPPPASTFQATGRAPEVPFLPSAFGNSAAAPRSLQQQGAWAKPRNGAAAAAAAGPGFAELQRQAIAIALETEAMRRALEASPAAEEAAMIPRASFGVM